MRSLKGDLLRSATPLVALNVTNHEATLFHSLPSPFLRRISSLCRRIARQLSSPFVSVFHSTPKYFYPVDRNSDNCFDPSFPLSGSGFVSHCFRSFNSFDDSPGLILCANIDDRLACTLAAEQVKERSKTLGKKEATRKRAERGLKQGKV